MSFCTHPTPLTIGIETGNRNRIGISIIVLLILCLLVLKFSPNFKSVESSRTAPYGGDFLQEWVGGQILLSDQRGKLYDTEFFGNRQHDPSTLGFHWNEASYYPPIYPPGYYLAVSPLSQIPYQTAAVVWLVGSLVCLFLVFYLVARHHPMGEHVWIWGSLLAAAFAPVLFSLNIGHKSMLILLVLTSTYLLLYHKKSFWAGLVLGVIAFKPHFILLLAVMMLLQRDWRFVGGLAVSGIGWLLLCVCAGPFLLLDYVTMLAGTTDYTQQGGYQLTMAHGLVSSSELSLGWLIGSFSKWVGRLAAMGVVIALAMALRRKVDSRSAAFAAWFSAIVIATVLVSPHFYQYDLAILVLPLLLGIYYVDFRRGLYAKMLAVTMMAFVVLAGLFEPVAALTGIQISLFLLIAWLLLAVRLSRSGDGLGDAKTVVTR